MKIVFPYDGYESLGIGYLAAISIEQGHKVDLHPLKFGDYIRGYSSQSIKNIEKEKKAILQLKPDIVAFSINSFMAGSLIKLALSIRESGVKTIAGGPHCTAEPELTAETNAFDAVIAGEADGVFLSSIESICKGDSTLPWLFTPDKRKAEYVSSDDIDILPFPAKKLFYDINSYESEDYKIITSRGCPYNCSFCAHSNPKIKLKYRRRSINNIIEELVLAKKNFGIKSVYFLDDVFTINGDWIKDFMVIYKQKINLPFHAISHPNNLNEEIVSHLIEGGCTSLRLGVQTTTERIKRNIGRSEDNQSVINVTNYLKNNRIKVEIDHIVNLPGESLQEARESVRFYNDLRPDSIKVYWLIPLPGTKLLNESIEQNRISGEQAINIRTGRAYGKHSYLFYNKSFNNSEWLGIHFILSYLPLLPRVIVAFLIKIKADRFLRIPSFLWIVGIPRILNMAGSWDMVGKEHLKRIYHKVRRCF